MVCILECVPMISARPLKLLSLHPSDRQNSLSSVHPVCSNSVVVVAAGGWQPDNTRELVMRIVGMVSRAQFSDASTTLPGHQLGLATYLRSHWSAGPGWRRLDQSARSICVTVETPGGRAAREAAASAAAGGRWWWVACFRVVLQPW